MEVAAADPLNIPLGRFLTISNDCSLRLQDPEAFVSVTEQSNQDVIAKTYRVGNRSRLFNPDALDTVA